MPRYKLIGGEVIATADPIDLPCVAPPYAVRADNGINIFLIPEEIFHKLFEEVEIGPPTFAFQKAAPAAKPESELARKPSPAKPTGVETSKQVRKPSPVAEKCLRFLKVHGPLTTAELSEYLYPDVASRFRTQNFSALSLDLRRKGWVERKEEPKTGLDKWFLTGAGEAQLQ